MKTNLGYGGIAAALALTLGATALGLKYAEKDREVNYRSEPNSPRALIERETEPERLYPIKSLPFEANTEARIEKEPKPSIPERIIQEERLEERIARISQSLGEDYRRITKIGRDYESTKKSGKILLGSDREVIYEVKDNKVEMIFPTGMAIQFSFEYDGTSIETKEWFIKEGENITVLRQNKGNLETHLKKGIMGAREEEGAIQRQIDGLLNWDRIISDIIR